ncbi:hypothetical protein [Endozoicomonas atrinae]|uniref:hypothetical protein n=1 Tax=Endozoicomonas atrinae TaxID=1333660 RepID=UPI003AFFD5E9
MGQNMQQSFEQRLDVQVDDVELLEDETYDTTRFVIRCLDEGDNVLTYASDTLNIETEGPVDVIGPKSISLVGGGIAFWVRTIGVSGEAIIRIRNERFGVVEQRIQVSKQSQASMRYEKSEQAVCLE